ncbi:MAG: D-xylose transport system permease protein [Acidobacteriota bacterium]|jgi:D-xylose transport system permease protein|nr:D-xylose transport system permease protein [Acidobacteriota bacterium]
MSQTGNQPPTNRPPTTADVSPPGAVPEGVEAKVGGFRIQADSLRAYTMIIALVAIWLFFQWKTISPQFPYGLFLHPNNFSNLLQQMAVTGVLAVGMLLVIVAGQIDLSVGSVVGLAGGAAAMMQEPGGLFGALGAAMVVGIIIGAVQGSLISYANIPAFIVTLGGLLAWRGVILGLSKGATIPVRQPFFRELGVGKLPQSAGVVLALIAIAAVVFLTISRNRARRRHGLTVPGVGVTALGIVVPTLLIVAFIYLMNSGNNPGLPVPVLVLLAVAILGAFLTQNTTFGRYLYAIGGNPDAARLSGINIRRYILAAYCVLGLLVGVASLLHTGRVGSASPDAGTYMELDAIAACVIGGTSLMGGRGTVSGAVVGALIMASLDNGMSLLNVENYTQYIVKGAVLVAAVGFDMLGRRKS